MNSSSKKIVVGLTGATGSALGVCTLRRLRELGIETHLCISKWGRRTLEYETQVPIDDVCRLATRSYHPGDQAAAISSGSFRHDGMVVIPCSVRTLAAIAHGLNDNLITRAADVTLKERRRLVLVVREAPLNQMHLENMLAVTRAGAVVVPPVPSFYNNPRTLEDVITHIVARVLDQLDVEDPAAVRWDGWHRDRHSGREGTRGRLQPSGD